MEAREKEITELLSTVYKLEKRLEGDVKAFCDLLKSIMELAREEGVDMSTELRKKFSDIYMCLKLHLAFHLGNETALRKENNDLRAFARDVLKLPETELNAPPDTNLYKLAINPGSKVLEIVSMAQQVLNNIFGWMVNHFMVKYCRVLAFSLYHQIFCWCKRSSSELRPDLNVAFYMRRIELPNKVHVKCDV